MLMDSSFLILEDEVGLSLLIWFIIFLKLGLDTTSKALFLIKYFEIGKQPGSCLIDVSKVKTGGQENLEEW